MTNPLFAAIDKATDEYRKRMGLEPLELCDCGKPATYLSMCDACYHSAQISSRENYSREIFGAGEDD